MTPVDTKLVLQLADDIVKSRDRWAALPSDDVQLTAIVEAMTTEVNNRLETLSKALTDLVVALAQPVETIPPTTGG